MTEQSTMKDSTLEFTAAEDSREFLVKRLTDKQLELSKLGLDVAPLVRANIQFDIAEIMLDVADAGMREAAWGLAKEAFIIYH